MEGTSALQDEETSLKPAEPEVSVADVDAATQQQLPLATTTEALEQQEQLNIPDDTETQQLAFAAALAPVQEAVSTLAAIQTPATASQLQTVAVADFADTASAAIEANAIALSPAPDSRAGESDKAISPDTAASPAPVSIPSSPEVSPAEQATGASATPPVAPADSVGAPDAAAVPQVESPALGFANTTFTVPTEKWQHQQAVPLGTTAAEIKHSLCSNWNITENALSVKYAGREMQDAESLSNCGIQAGADVEIELVIRYQLLATKRKAEPAKVAVMPERFEVKVFQGAEQEAKLVTVRVDVTQKQSKRYQGGYRDKRNGALYHHADSQTDKQAGDKANTQRYEREVQTVATKQRGGQTCREAQVQMARPDLLLDTSRDRFLSPSIGKYVTADEVWAEKERCAAIIQRFTRGWLARIRVRFMLKEARQGTAAANRAAAEAAEQQSALKRFEAQRRLQPRSPADFALLHSELAAWHQAETARIKAADLSDEERHLAFCHLLHQETKLLQSVDRLKADADVVAHEQRIAGALASMATPKHWSLSNGGLLDVHTPATMRAAELRGLYRGLQLVLGAGERLDVLLHVKCKVKEFNTSLTKELLQLIEREADLINRGRKSDTMEGLRKRISTLFLQIIESPAFNPEAANFFNLSPKTCSSETYMYGSMTAADAAGIAVKSLLV